MKRIIALLLALLMVISLTACGGGDSQSGGGASNINPAETAFDTQTFIAEMPSELKGTTVNFLTWYDPNDRPAEKSAIEAFETASGIDVNVISVEYGQAYNDKLAGLVATGDSPDVIRMSDPKAAWMKVLQPIVNTGYDFSGSAWSKTVKDRFSVDGVQYAANLTYTPFIVFSTLHYHKSTMEEYGFEDPWELYKKGEWTWDKLIEMCETWVKQGTDYYGVGTSSFGMVNNTAGKDFVSYNGSRWSMNLYDSNLLDIYRTVLDNRDKRIFVQKERVVFDAIKHTSLFQYVDSTGLEASSVYSEKTKRRGDFAATLLPKLSGYDYYLPVGEMLGWGVPIGAKNPKAVPYFISWYANLAMYDLNTFFYDERSKEIYETAVSIENKFSPMTEEIFDFDTSPFIWNLFNSAKSAQITTFIEEQEYKCQDKLNEYNAVLSNMNKEIK